MGNKMMLVVMLIMAFVGFFQVAFAGPFDEDAVGVAESSSGEVSSLPAPEVPPAPAKTSPASAKPAKGETTWTDVKTDNSGGFRMSNKTTVYYMKNGKKVSRSVGSSTTDDLVALLQDLNRQGIKITELEIKGHGAPELQQMGAGTFLIATNKSVLAHMKDGRDIDITPLLRTVLTPDAKVNLNGCKTGRGSDPVAQEFSRALPGRTVTGGAFYQLGIPFLAKSFGTKMHFKDGVLLSKKWYRVD